MLARCGILTLPKIEMPWKKCKNSCANWLLLNGIASSYEELLDLTDLKPLQDRRLESKLGLLFKLVHNLYNDAVTALLSNRFQFATVWGKKEAIL